jgi:hypothetical protein
MPKLIISDLAVSKALDSKAMAAVRGGNSALVLPLNVISVSTAFASYNDNLQVAAASNDVGAFNFGVVKQNNTQAQISNQAGNSLLA